MKLTLELGICGFLILKKENRVFMTFYHEIEKLLPFFDFIFLTALFMDS